jgi:hypothetical protein
MGFYPTLYPEQALLSDQRLVTERDPYKVDVSLRGREVGMSGAGL